MSRQAFIVNGKGDLPVSQLHVALQNSQALVRPTVADSVKLSSSSEQPATQEDWANFYSAVNKIKAPITILLDVLPTKSVTNSPADKDGITAVILPSAVNSALVWATQNAGGLRDYYLGPTFDDKEGHAQWTQQVIIQARQNSPQFNYVVVCTSHSTNFQGQQDGDWATTSYTYEDLIVRSTAYQLYAFGAAFTLRGDGGFLNWAFIGNVVFDTGGNAPRTVTFSAP